MRNALARWDDRVCLGPDLDNAKGISRMQLSHRRPVGGASFDEPNLVSSAGLVPVVRLAEQAGVRGVPPWPGWGAGGRGGVAQARGWGVAGPVGKGADPGGEGAALVAGMVAGADSIDDLAL